jgi:hypothetical protein
LKGKIVLLSCNDAPSSQALADALGELSNTPRSVVAWEGEVKVFENGRIEGAGACKEYRAGVTTAQDITTSAPIGKVGAAPSGRFIRLSGLNIAIEEANGGHSIARHGEHLPMSEMEQRVLGTHPTMRQSRTAMRFTDQVTHEDAVARAYAHHRTAIESHFRNGGGYMEWEFSYGALTGSGYTNTGTLSRPIAVPVTSQKVKIAFRPDASNSRGYSLDSAYPSYP